MFPFQNPDLDLESRLSDLIGRLTLEEKILQMEHKVPAIDRLGIPQYDWWNECLHGVARAGVATVFPQAIGLAATWNEHLIFQMADVISTEARAKHHEFARQGQREINQGLTFWSPNINICRDPRWGRAQETYGEDPFLAGRLAVQFVKGLQGDHPVYLKTVATPKHFAVHSGPEADRHHFDARIEERDLWETYLPHFEACIREARAHSIMCAYNRLEGDACCASYRLLTNILREQWGFDGYVVSDCWAISDIYERHDLADDAPAAAAMSVAAGCDLNCGHSYRHLLQAVADGLITEEEIDVSVRRLFRARFKLGMFDPPERVPYAATDFALNDCAAHAGLAEEVARQSLVLLKNENQFLPLSKELGVIAVIGPSADDTEVLLGNYNGTPSHPVSILAGIRGAVADGTEVTHTPGCPLLAGDPREVAAQQLVAVSAAKRAEVVVFVGGLSADLEREEFEVEAEGFAGGDRTDLDLPRVQHELLVALHETGTPVVLVLLNGAALSVTWAADHLPAILEAWYPGQAAGPAVAAALFGDLSPAGRLPVTFYRCADDLPPFDDYAMAGRTYRYFEGDPLFPFGHGLSYTRFEYCDLDIPESIRAGDPLPVSVTVRNAGERLGDEVVQLYVSAREASAPVPRRSLQGFRRITLEPGASEVVDFVLQPQQLGRFDERLTWVVDPGAYEISIGGKQPGFKGLANAHSTGVLTGRIRLLD